jgi:iron(II)-dependent oxidoreductase
MAHEPDPFLRGEAMPAPETLQAWTSEARERTFGLISDLSDEQLLWLRLDIVNPLLWEIGHVAWFQELWVLREALGRPPLSERFDALYNSSTVPHDTRWDLPLPSRAETLDYLARVRDAVLEALSAEPTPAVLYHALYSVYHEDMHGEAFTWTRQTHGFPAPPTVSEEAGDGPSRRATPAGDAEVPGGTHLLGGSRDEPFVFDNEKWEHPVEVAPFRMARRPVTQGEMADFVEDGGYRRRELWSDEGWEWRSREQVEAPLYWRRGDGGWERRAFDRWVPLGEDLPMIHASWHEAEAWCRWAGRRLPTEAQWEAAATAGAEGPKRRYPWGTEPAGPERANLDALRPGCLPAGCLEAGESRHGLRGLLGDVWEWTSGAFEPFPGFTRDPYRDYSFPWFGNHKVLRGGAWPSRSRLVRNGYRNYALPHRRDLWTGFRTCAR